MDEELRRLYIQLLADVFADLNQFPAALTAGAGLGFMTVLDARQVLGQGLAPGALPLNLRLGYLLLDFGFDGSTVGAGRLTEQVSLLR